MWWTPVSKLYEITWSLSSPLPTLSLPQSLHQSRNPEASLLDPSCNQETCHCWCGLESQPRRLEAGFKLFVIKTLEVEQFSCKKYFQCFYFSAICCCFLVQHWWNENKDKINTLSLILIFLCFVTVLRVWNVVTMIIISDKFYF